MGENEKVEAHILKKFEIVKKIGSGAYGVVWKVIERHTHRTYALKKNFDAFQNPTDAQRTYREIMFLQQFQHPNIIQLKEVIRSHNDRDIYILFEFMDIDLYILIRENMLGEQHKRYIIHQVAKALHYLHSAQLIHRDIKPSNILVNQDCLAKICDFGLVRSVEQDDQIPPVLTDYIATRWYRAPEILLGSKKYSKAADVWSFGCLVGELLRGKPLFPGHSTLNQIERVLTWTGPPNIQDLKSLKTDFGKEMLDLLSKIKPVNKKDWFTNCSAEGMDLITRSLHFNPDKRPSMLEILKHPFLRQFSKNDVVQEAEGKIRVSIDDNEKLSLKQYRALIYKQVQESEEKNLSGGECVMLDYPLEKMHESRLHHEEIGSKTVYKNRLQKALVRSASKNKEESVAKSGQKESNTVSIKKKYESLLGKTREELTKTKYVKTEEKEEKSAFPKRKKSDNIVKYYTSSDKKKKSVSLCDGKKDTEIIAKYMYQHRNF